MCSFHAHLLLKSLPKSRCQNDNSVLILTPNVVDTLSYTDVVISYTDVVIFSLGVDVDERVFVVTDKTNIHGYATSFR